MFCFGVGARAEDTVPDDVFGVWYVMRTLSPQFCLRKFEVRFKLGANNEVKPNTKE